MDQVVCVLYNDQRLVEIGHSLVVDLRHILSHTDLLLVVQELHLGWVGGEVDPTDNIGSFVAPIRDHGRTDDLLLDKLLELAIRVSLLPKLIYLVEAGYRRHKSENGVDGDCDA